MRDRKSDARSVTGPIEPSFKVLPWVSNCLVERFEKTNDKNGNDKKQRTADVSPLCILSPYGSFKRAQSPMNRLFQATQDHAFGDASSVPSSNAAA
jgi:hypothetical protein